MKLTTKLFWSLLSSALLVIPMGCKPTEANYRNAYDTAVQKKQKEATDPDIDLHGMKRDDVPNRVRIGTDSAYVRHEALRVHTTGPQGPLHPYCVVVGKYRMPTNAEAEAGALRSQGYNAFLIANSRSELYVVAEAFPDLKEAVAFLKKFMTANPGRPYVGLPGEPVIEVPLRGKF